MSDVEGNAYTGLVEAEDDARWAFGGGFEDPLAGVDVAVPAGVDAAALAAYSTALADDSLVLAQRLAEWCTRAPELAWNQEKGSYDFGEPDWAELAAVISGHGPCNRQRLTRRAAAHREGGWVREAAAAYALKQEGRR